MNPYYVCGLLCLAIVMSYILWRWEKALKRCKDCLDKIDGLEEEVNSYRKTLLDLPIVRVIVDSDNRPLAATVGEVSIANRSGTQDRVIEFNCLSGVQVEYKIESKTIETGDLVQVPSASSLAVKSLYQHTSY